MSGKSLHFANKSPWNGSVGAFFAVPIKTSLQVIDVYDSLHLHRIYTYIFTCIYIYIILYAYLYAIHDTFTHIFTYIYIYMCMQSASTPMSG